MVAANLPPTWSSKCAFVVKYSSSVEIWLEAIQVPTKECQLLPAASAVQLLQAASNMSTCQHVLCAQHISSRVPAWHLHTLLCVNITCTHLWKRICIAECSRLETVVNLLLQLVTDFNWEHHDKCHVDISILALLLYHVSTNMCQLCHVSCELVGDRGDI